MQIFRATEIRVNAATIIADDIHHASHTLLNAFHDGLRHRPGVSCSIGPWEPPADLAPDLLRQFADQHAGGLAHFADNGWEVIGADRYRTFP